MKNRNVNQLACFGNSLKEIAPNLLFPQKRMQQYIPLYASSFISNFHCRYELNKFIHNRFSPIAPKTSPIVRALFRRVMEIQTPFSHDNLSHEK